MLKSHEVSRFLLPMEKIDRCIASTIQTFAFNRRWPREDVEDLKQEVWITIWKNRYRYRPESEGQELSFVKVMTMRKCFEIVRRKRLTIGISEYGEDRLLDRGTQREFDRVEDAALLESLNLSDKELDILAASIAGQSAGETAQRQGRTPDAQRAAKHRLMKKIRSVLLDL